MDNQNRSGNRVRQPRGPVMPPLNDEELRVLLGRETEAPFSGRYENSDEPGLYRCRACGSPLYRSDDKFDAGCGWPSFDDEIPGAVARFPDPDGRRTEIACARCGGHLGHVFAGEGLTPKNLRHCVNSASLAFEPASPIDPDRKNGAEERQEAARTAVFAGGCFWGVEDAFRGVPGVRDVLSGYAGGNVPYPAYGQVCSGTTGHAEAVRVTYDPARVSYEELARLFFEIHDPTQINRQGPDVGPQYRSVIFYANEEQKRIAEKLTDTLRRRGWNVATGIEPAGEFWPAEEYHQHFAERTGRGGHRPRIPRFEKGPSGLQEKRA